tara:strand:- start:575 stop:1597 length:1023 start_codon:yes stop_codon:yes gene_type:complete
MKVLINAPNNKSVVCRVAKTSIKKCFEEIGAMVDFDKDNYKEYNLIFVYSDSTSILSIKANNQKAIIGILDPKLNNKKQYQQAQNADFLLVSSLEQQLFAEKFNSKTLIYNWFPKIENNTDYKTSKSDSLINIGYQGNKIHLNSINGNISKALEKLYRENQNIRLLAIYDRKLVGKWKVGRPDIPIEDIQWEESNYFENLSRCSVGIIPNLIPIRRKTSHFFSRISLRTSLYNYNKNDYLIRFKLNSNPNRFWEFSQLNIPVIADLYPSACQVLTHGYNGFLAYDRETWYRALSILINNQKIRRKLGERLNKTMLNNFSIEISQKRLLNYLLKEFPIIFN